MFYKFAPCVSNSFLICKMEVKLLSPSRRLGGTPGSHAGGRHSAWHTAAALGRSCLPPGSAAPEQLRGSPSRRMQLSSKFLGLHCDKSRREKSHTPVSNFEPELSSRIPLPPIISTHFLWVTVEITKCLESDWPERAGPRNLEFWKTIRKLPSPGIYY